ncbi:hypothetical protein EV363DRAFT_1238886 [Boletus edulis]|uniref:BTB domain-containing protein n=1 Tax=Boletus edulis BED1 TaxID=1328754 RepID=A0AAD4GMH0_BOLED|nr:hypothetical protein EV363DRAFT_1238886 [Boletus edulis]KAF8452707.1 hypothetical protein L210DRAFT_2053017 [Boletus edulis BED1]
MQDMKTEMGCLDPWLEDGNIVITVQEKHFRVHRSVLCFYSDVFRDMFAVSHPCDNEEEMMDGCPVVRLQDAVADVEIMLKALYDRSYIFLPGTHMPISVLSAFLRMGKKYVIRQLFKEAERMLSFGTSPLVQLSAISAAGNVILFPRLSGADPFNFMVMNLASEVGLLSITVIAGFYCCVACPALSIVDGYEYNGVRYDLSAGNKRLCFLVQRYIAEVERQLFQCLAFPAHNCVYGSSSRSPCCSGLLSNLRSIQCLKCPFTQWMNTWDDGLCVSCRAVLRKKHEGARMRLWKNLPVDLDLGRWESLDAEMT